MRFIDVAIAVMLGAMIVMNIASMRATRRELRQARLLQQQMEQDHAKLVRNVIAAGKVIAKYDRALTYAEDEIDEE